jgi:hypothetical protein
MISRSSPSVIRPYHLAAPALVAAVPVLALCAATDRGRRAAAAAGAAYLAACVAAGVRAGAGEPAAVRVRIPATFVVMHAAWGFGFWAGVAEAALRIPNGGGSPPMLPRDAHGDPVRNRHPLHTTSSHNE